MTSDLADTLSMLARAADGSVDDWWVIGSAAIVLHGGEISKIKDVDLMMSERDAEAFLDRVGARRGGSKPSNRFRSSVFGVWNDPPIPVEAFGGFKLATQGGWREVCFSTREQVTVEGATIFVPSVTELVALLRSFERMKDLERVSLLRA